MLMHQLKGTKYRINDSIRTISTKRIEYKTCQYCQTRFDTTFKSSLTKFCSTRCSDHAAYTRKRDKKIAASVPKPIEYKICQYCQTQFDATYKSSLTKFCSMRCNAQANYAIKRNKKIDNA